MALALGLAVVLGACSGSSSPAASGSAGSVPAAGTQAPASLPADSGAADCVGAGVTFYKGPGTYDLADLAGNLGHFQVVVDHDGFVGDDATKTTATATVAADGSGSVTAVGMQPVGDSNKVQQPVDLTLTWTCYTK